MEIGNCTWRKLEGETSLFNIIIKKNSVKKERPPKSITKSVLNVNHPESAKPIIAIVDVDLLSFQIRKPSFHLFLHAFILLKTKQRIGLLATL